MWASSPKLAAFILALMLAVSSCSPDAAPASDHPTQPFPKTPTLMIETPSCTEKTIPPTITDIQPPQVLPGSEITVIGTGGYIQDSCGGINESARSFKLYLDKKPAGDLLCYVNHCETKITVSDTITAGMHCLSAQKETCEFQFQVVSK